MAKFAALFSLAVVLLAKVPQVKGESIFLLVSEKL